MPDLTPVLVDASVLRDKLHNKINAAFTSVLQPGIDVRGRVLTAENIRVVHKPYGPDREKAALLEGASLTHPVKATLILKDANGQVLDKQENFTLGRIPHLTDRHTMVIDGNEYQMANQLRRKAGVYTARAGNGELKSVFNLAKGQNFEVNFSPEKGTFSWTYGSTNIPLYAALRSLGTSHQEIATALGAGVADANAKAQSKHTQTALNRLYSQLEHPTKQREDATDDEKRRAVLTRLESTKLDPEVTARTLGEAHDKVSATALLQAAKKILAVHNGQQDPDDTDSLTFKTFHAMDDFLPERVKLMARTWIPKVRQAFVGKNSIKAALTASPFTVGLKKFVTTSSLAAVPTGINPMELIDHAVKITALGEGGIPSERAIPMDARMVHDTHFGAIDPVRTPESFHAGVDVRATLSAHRDDHGNLYTTLRNVKTGKNEAVKAGDLDRYVVALAGESKTSPTVRAFKHGKETRVARNELTHELPALGYQYSPATTLLPFLHNMQGNRAIMASKMGTQAVPLTYREPPLVQVKSHLPGGESYEAIWGHTIVPTAQVSGVVRKIDSEHVFIQPGGHKTAAADPGVAHPYQTHFPMPAKTSLHHTLKVKAGDKVEAGQHLGDSNYTRDGVLALGINLNTAYIPYYGYNSNDAVVISESAAKKLTSEHMYREVYMTPPGLELKKSKHKAFYGAKYRPEQYAKLDDYGVVMPNQIVNPKDPLVLGLTKQAIQGADLIFGRISKSLATPYRDNALLWEHASPGKVVSVQRNDHQITILIRTEEPMQVGDKLAGRHGNKGVVSAIIPDHQMFQDESGKPIDLLLSSAGINSRVNPSQLHEVITAKVAKKIGKPIVYDNETGHDAEKWTRELAAKHGVKINEVLYDPMLKRHIGAENGGVTVGPQYIYKLFKDTAGNFAAASAAGPYDINEQPLKTGGSTSPKGIAKMEFDALVAHGARNFLKEVSTVKGTKNDEYWRALQLGLPPPNAKTAFAFNKFTSMLEGAGLRVERSGSKFRLLPMTDADVVKKSAGALQNAGTLRAKDLRPEPGGLFDVARTGGPSGTLYSHIDLHEPIPNPVFKEPVRRLLGLTEKAFDEKLATHGGGWFKSQLAEINPEQKLQMLQQELRTAKGPRLNDVVKQIKYLQALKTQGLKPQDAYVLSKVPVVPPVFRPITQQIHDPTQLQVSDPNKLYGYLWDSNHVLKTTAVPSDLGKHRAQVYNAVASLYGVETVDDEELKGQKVKGFLSTIAGVGSPKGGFFQRKLLRRTQSVSGRGTIVPDLNLGMDEIGIPKDMLWQALQDLLVARMVRKGYRALDAAELVKNRAPAAEAALQEEIKERPVLFNRAPTLHRWSVVAGWPVPVSGKTVRINPFAEKGMAADYDGDTVQLHFPVTPGGVEDAKQMLLSELLLSDQSRNKLMVFPQHEAILGLVHATKAPTTPSPVKHFKTEQDAISAWRRGELKLTDRVQIG